MGPKEFILYNITFYYLEQCWNGSRYNKRATFEACHLYRTQADYHGSEREARLGGDAEPPGDGGRVLRTLVRWSDTVHDGA